MPVFLAQLLLQFQIRAKIDNATLTDNYETTTLPKSSTVEITTLETIIPSSNDDDDIWYKICEYMLYVW
jgi:hypothetical protein